MNCIIIDDESAARVIVEQLCKSEGTIEVIDQFSNALQAIKYLNQNDVDLIFLDIHMPDFTGFDLIQTLKKPPRIILTTSDEKFAIDAFEYECIVDYLVKPITLPRFVKAIEKAKKFTFRTPVTDKQNNSSAAKEEKDEDQQLYINIDRRLIKIEIPSINIVEAKGDYILIKTQDKNYTVHSTLKKIEEKLPNDLFLKVHRSYIINLKKIVDIEDNSVLIEKDVIPVSRSNRSELMKRLNLL
ncbi:LytTR family DNA-binding domain-containing protein [uncultured Tenacibaculum sp.]|uniref:LytR/AlgR family response regulator transcription factor n=1 Tax=uncultured Tenacibaculum sp. TaxID=174713 RepID=UPI00260D8BE3|nr:LytTR family DNA-binding domain-containing protein [uncultured Tenacibaculum sp.]